MLTTGKESMAALLGNIHHSLTVLAYFCHRVGVHTCRQLISSSLPTSRPSSSDVVGRTKTLALRSHWVLRKKQLEVKMEGT